MSDHFPSIARRSMKCPIRTDAFRPGYIACCDAASAGIRTIATRAWPPSLPRSRPSRDGDAGDAPRWRSVSRWVHSRGSPTPFAPIHARSSSPGSMPYGTTPLAPTSQIASIDSIVIQRRATMHSLASTRPPRPGASIRWPPARKRRSRSARRRVYRAGSSGCARASKPCAKVTNSISINYPSCSSRCRVVAAARSPRPCRIRTCVRCCRVPSSPSWRANSNGPSPRPTTRSVLRHRCPPACPTRTIRRSRLRRSIGSAMSMARSKIGRAPARHCTKQPSTRLPAMIRFCSTFGPTRRWSRRCRRRGPTSPRRRRSMTR